MKRIALLLTLLSVLLLASCGGDTVVPQADSVQKMGFAEGELFDTANNPTGHVLAAGETGILMLEAVGTSSQSGDTGTAGTDEIWLETKTGGPVQLEMATDGSAMFASAEILDSTRQSQLRIDIQTPSAQATVPPGKYILRVVSSHTNSDPVPLFITLPAEDSQATAKTSAKSVSYNAGAKTQLLQTNSCVGCDLRYANLSHQNLAYANLNSANLYYANLTSADLYRAGLVNANLRNSFLYNTNLTSANLTSANLTSANLSDANLTSANLTSANLSYANLEDAYLPYAYLPYTNLSGANLIGANLYYTNLSHANLIYADLTDADLTNANLIYADLTDADLTNAITTGTKW
jgi:uncharacterized protein YjbI with pentapeptide repeats